MVVFRFGGGNSRSRKTKRPYLFKTALNQKSKGTLLSSTFKVQENKVPLFCQLEAVSKSYDHFVIFGPLEQEIWKNVNILFLEPLLKKRPLGGHSPSIYKALYTKHSPLGCNISQHFAKTCSAEQIGHALIWEIIKNKTV